MHSPEQPTATTRRPWSRRTPPSLMRRVEPAQVRYLRLDEQRLTTVSTVTLPEKADPTQTFVLTAASVRTHGAEVTSCCTRSAGADR